MQQDYVCGRRFSATGRMVSMTHREFAELIEANGGQFTRYPPRGQLEIVVGCDCWGDLQADETKTTQVLQRAKQLQAQGYPITICSEDEFLIRSGLAAEDRRLRGQHTIGDISRLLKVPVSRIRRWVRVGLIQPSDTKNHLAFFDFDEVAFARRLAASLAAGASLGDLRQAVERLRRWLPSCEADLVRLAQLERDGRVLVRLDEQIIDDQRQRYLDFDAGTSAVSLLADRVCRQEITADACFDQALQLEDEERWHEAKDAYRAAIDLSAKDPTLYYNFANVLFRVGELDAAVENYQACLTCDATYAEAWNNLGLVCAEQRNWEAAAQALERAVELVPDYADAHFNLADVYRSMGRQHAAVRHARLHEQLSTAFRLKLFDSL